MTQDQGTAATGLRILSREQVSFYEEHGYVLVESAIGDGWLDRLRAASQEFVEESRTLASSNRRLDVDAEMGPMGIVLRGRQLPAARSRHDRSHRGLERAVGRRRRRTEVADHRGSHDARRAGLVAWWLHNHLRSIGLWSFELSTD
jgi:hypothetical protein